MADYTIEQQNKFNKAMAVYEAGDYEGALYLLRVLYKEGLLVCAGKIAMIYEFDLESFDEAKRWYLNGIGGFDQECYIGLAAMYARGKGVNKDYTKAKELLKSHIFTILPHYRQLLLLGDIYFLENNVLMAKYYWKDSSKEGSLLASSKLVDLEGVEGRFVSFFLKKPIMILRLFFIKKMNPFDPRIIGFG